MIIYALVYFALPLQTLGCENTASPVPELQKRSRIYTTTPTEGYIDDGFIKSAWYNAWYNTSHGGEQYLMPDNNTIPSLSTCGGLQPIYLQGKHPDVKALNEISVAAEVCIRTPNALCGFKETVDIRKCNGQIQYYLVSTFKRHSSYCFDAPDIYGVAEKDFGAAPTQVTIGKVTVKPILEHINKMPNIKLLCEISSVSGDLSKLFFHTQWYINAELKFYFEAVGKTTPLTENELGSTGLGKNISCGVRLSKTTNGQLTNTALSNVFFAGIKVQNTDVIIIKGNDDTKIHLIRTVPFGCQEQNSNQPRCSFAVQMAFSQTCKGNIASKQEMRGLQTDQQKCGVEFLGLKSGEDLNAVDKEHDMVINTIDIDLQDPKSYILQLKVQGNTDHEIWDDYILEPVQVTVIDDLKYQNKICSAVNDPHMTTFKGYAYEHQYPGPSIMYRNVKYESEVQIQTKSCNSNVAQCTCAVAIRVQGDVFRINYCSDDKKNWVNEMTSCQTGGAIIVKDDNTFFTAIGTKITVNVDKNSGLMNVNIRLAPKDVDNADGLCGNFGKANEMAYRNGMPTNDRNVSGGRNFHNKFSADWRLNSNDMNYLEAKCIVVSTKLMESNLTRYCVCEKCLNVSSPCNSGYTNQAHCSPSQFLNCPVTSSSRTEYECKRWETNCPNKNRKKRETKRETIRKRQFSYKQQKKRTKNSLRKRQTTIFTESDAMKLCTESIAKHPAFEHVQEATEGFNVTQAIMNCVFDTYEGQSNEWVQSYISVVTDVVDMNMEMDPNYTETHADEVVTFRRLACPLNCSGNGICTDEGNCSCSEGFRGSDCSINLSAELSIYGVDGNGLCDIDQNDCGKVEIKTFDLVKGFVCKVEERKILIDGTKTKTLIEILEGDFINLFTAGCDLLTQRKKRSLDTNNIALASEYDVSISNDGNTFSEKVSVVLFDPTCQTISNRTDGSTTVYLTDNTCFIDGNCYLPFETNRDDSCKKCIPSTDPLSWTLDCTKSDNILDQPAFPVYAIAIVSVTPLVIIAIVVVTILFKIKKNPKLPRAVSPGRNKVRHDEMSFPS